MTWNVVFKFRPPRWLRLACLSTVILLPTLVWADDAARAAMQQSLNAEVFAAPFDPGDVDKAKAYAEEALKKKVKPVVTPPSYWQPGWSCARLTRYHGYQYNHYRNCIYHHRYYGRYW